MSETNFILNRTIEKEFPLVGVMPKFLKNDKKKVFWSNFKIPLIALACSLVLYAIITLLLPEVFENKFWSFILMLPFVSSLFFLFERIAHINDEWSEESYKEFKVFAAEQVPFIKNWLIDNFEDYKKKEEYSSSSSEGYVIQLAKAFSNMENSKFKKFSHGLMILFYDHRYDESLSLEDRYKVTSRLGVSFEATKSSVKVRASEYNSSESNT